VRLLAAICAGVVLAVSAAAQTPFAMPADGQERITHFLSDVHVARNGDLDVTETIQLVALGKEIRHGIQRDFPTSYTSRAGQRTTVGFDVVSVEQDGRPAAFTRIGLANGARIRIGDADTTLPIGEHRYVIRYRTTRQIAYGSTSDELYWNATGTGWTFPIDSAEARITLPAPARFGDRTTYTGPQGAVAHDAEVIAERPGHIAFRTTRPLPPNAGLTVAAAFPKGVLDAPGAGRRLGWWLADWGALIAGLGAVAGLLGYYLRAWWRVGRGPRAGTIVPIFSPPDKLTPAAVRYIARMGLDNRAFTAAIVDLGVRGRLRIRKEGAGWFSKGTTTLERADPADAKPGALPEPEAEMFDSLFDDGGTLVLKQSNHGILQSARTALEHGLEGEYCGILFRRNREWAVWGLMLIPLAVVVLAVVAMVFAGPVAGAGALAMPVLAFACLAGTWGIHRLHDSTSGCAALLTWAVGALLALGAFLIAGKVVLEALAAGRWVVLLPLLALPFAITAFWWMAAPTSEGRAVMDRIAGFKHYLGITEEARLETLHPPEKTPELFERYLPYAIALDVENRWAERFAGVLAAAAAAGGTATAMGWYSGSGNIWDDPGGFASSVGSSLDSTISSAATSPSSSGGGSSGGGSSGGGGGGGGGSGW